MAMAPTSPRKLSPHFVNVPIAPRSRSVPQGYVYVPQPNPSGDCGKAGSRVSLERGGKPTRAVLTAANILNYDAGH